MSTPADSAADPNGLDFIQQLRRQEKAAFTRLVQSQQQALKRFIRAIAGQHLSEDILQETWLSAYRGLPKFEGRAELKSWLFTIARNEATKQLRSRNLATASSSSVNDKDDNPDPWLEQQFGQDGNWLDSPQTWELDTPEELLQAEHLRACIDTTLSQMQPDQRAVLKLRELEQLSMHEIAAVTGLSDSNVRVLLHRARLQLLHAIRHYQLTGECL